MLSRSEVERQFPFLQEATYLNNAAQAPIPQCTLQAIGEITAALARPHEVPDVQGAIDRARRLLAGLMNARPREITFVPNTSVGISAAACALPLERGDEVLIPENEHPTLVYPWLNLQDEGIQIRRIPWMGSCLSPGDIIDRVGNRTRVVALSGVDYLRGFRHDVETIGAFCRNHDIYLVVDGIQALGVMPVDVRQQGISILAAGGYKWLMSGRGNGCLFVAEEVARQMRPRLVGRHGVQGVSDSGELIFYPDARRFQTGAWNLPGLIAFNSSIDLLQDCGQDAVTARVLRLTDRLIGGLDRLGVKVLSCREAQHRSSIVSFTTDRDARLVSWLGDAGVYIAQRGVGLRVGIHFYNCCSDVDRLLQLVECFLKG